MKNLSLIALTLILLIFFSCNKEDDDSSDDNNNTPTNETGTFTDSRDGQTYAWVKIGNQTWMSENLNFKADTGCCIYNDSTEQFADTYGRLYNWETAKVVCPNGWHLPSDNEWYTLSDFLGGEEIAGGKLKEIGTTHWFSPNTGATNESGFTALPGGCLDVSIFRFLGERGYWWSSTELSSNYAAERILNYTDRDIGRKGDSYKHYKYSVRCIKD